jgi:hypothetical protein
MYDTNARRGRKIDKKARETSRKRGIERGEGKRRKTMPSECTDGRDVRP